MLYMSKVFADKARRKYGLVSNFLYHMSASKAWDKKLFWAQILMAVPNVTASFLATLLPSKLVADLTARMTLSGMILELAFLAALMCLCNVASNMMLAYCEMQGDFISFHYANVFALKMMDVDYDYLEDKDYQKISGNAWRTARFGQGVSGAATLFPMFLYSMAGVLIYGVLIGRKSILLLLVIMASVSFSLFLLSLARKKHAQYYEQLQLSSRRENYITEQATDSSAGKDIRLYHLASWFLEKYEASLNEMGRIYGIIHDWYLFRNVSHAFLQLIMDGMAYGMLIHMLVNGKITAAEFVFYIGLISGFSVYFETALRQIMSFGNTSASISYLREFLETENGWSDGEGVGEEALKKMREQGLKLEFRDVTFTYPGNEKPTLKKINMVIKPGEKVALIGLNGAGKTTLVKLMCGFYHPTEGEIFVNDIPINHFTRDEYYSLVSVLFQDSTMMAVSLDENLTGQNPEDIDRADWKEP